MTPAIAPEELARKLELHRKYRAGQPDGERLDLAGANLAGANLEGANLEGAYLAGAYLEGANLEGANLEGANLEGAYLEGANLEGANLEGANLEGAYLEGANLEGANLEGAYLAGAYLAGANLEGANLEGAKIPDAITLPEGVTFGEFIDVVLPALFKAGGRSVLPEAWVCHSWQNCPMAEAFGVHGLSDIPIVWRPWANRFVQLFDGKALEGAVKERVFKACGIGCTVMPPAPVAKPKAARKAKKRVRK